MSIPRAPRGFFFRTGTAGQLEYIDLHQRHAGICMSAHPSALEPGSWSILAFPQGRTVHETAHGDHMDCRRAMLTILKAYTS